MNGQLKAIQDIKNLSKRDNIKSEDLANFKNYPIVDNKRPKLCADRLDGIILTSIGWTKNITKEEIKEILDNIGIYINKDNEEEIGFKDYIIAKKVLDLSDEIDAYCHSKEDNYMMELLANITKKAIELGIIKYKELYTLTETEVFKLFKQNGELSGLLYQFKTIKKEDIPVIEMPKIKKRDLNPLINGQRIKRL